MGRAVFLIEPNRYNLVGPHHTLCCGRILLGLSLVHGKQAERHRGVGRRRGRRREEESQPRRQAGAASGMGDGRAGGANRPAWLQQYELVGKIGEGTYGLVFLARLKPSHPAPGRRGPPIAIKKFKQSKEGDGVSPTAIREIMVCSFFALLLALRFLYAFPPRWGWSTKP